MTELLGCPFCGAPAEADSRQGFRAIMTGAIEDAAAIYCTRCAVQMTHCYSDHPGVPREDLMADLVERWNHRHSGGDADRSAELTTAWMAGAERERDRVAEDSARMDWFSGGTDRFLSQCPTGEWCAQDDTVGAWYGETPRAAIDAARAGERG